MVTHHFIRLLNAAIWKFVIESVQNQNSGIQLVAVNTKICKLPIENPMNNAGFTPLDLAEDSAQ